MDCGRLQGTEGGEDEGGSPDELAVSFEDIGALRRSLEGDEVIRSILGGEEGEVMPTWSVVSFQAVQILG